MRRTVILGCHHILAVPAVILLVAGMGWAQAVSPMPARDTGPSQEPAGTARLSISVVAADTGTPVKRARISLYGAVTSPMRPVGGQGPLAGVTLISPGAAGSVTGGGTTFTPIGGSVAAAAMPGRLQRDAESDEQGRAEFASLPSGRFSLMVQPPSPYVRLQRPQLAQVRDGEATSLVVRVERGGAITGRIVDDQGEPIAHVMVSVLGKRIPGTSQLMPAASSANTDDRGQYRVFDLPPGDYYVSGAYMRVLPGTSAWQPHLGYVPTYYPGAATLEGARLVTVRSGQESTGVDFGMLQGRLGRIRATALDAAGNPLTGANGSLGLSAQGPDAFTRGMIASRSMGDGVYVFDDVPAGDYGLTAYARPLAAGPPTEGAWVPVRVNGEEVAVEIRLNKGATLSGRVVIEGPPPTPPPADAAAAARAREMLRVMVSAAPATGISTQGFAPGRSDPVGDDGLFRLTGVRGSMTLRVMSPLAAVKAIRRGGEDLMGARLDLSGNEEIEDIEIVLTTDLGHLTGILTDARGRPAAGVWLLAFPDDPKLWFQASSFIRPTQSISAEMAAAIASRAAAAAQAGGATAPPSAAASAIPRRPGQFSFLRLLPGRYLVAVLPEEDGNGINMSQFDAEKLSSLRQRATPVVVAAGETTTVTLQVNR